MRTADQGGRRRRGCESGGADRFVWSIVLFAIVLGGTQVLLAQHGQDSNVRAEKSQMAGQGDESAASGEQRKHWSADPVCFEQKSDIPDRTVSRSWTLVSPDGLYKAYAMNDAVTERSGGEISGCKSTTKLFVSGPGSNEAKVVLTIEPRAYVSANSIELVDWSPRGHLLLLTEGMWVSASDAGGKTVHIHDADSGDMSGEDSFEDAFLQRLGANCVSTFEPIGFSPGGQVVVKALPDVDEDGILQKDSYVQKPGVWMLNLGTGAVSRVRDEYTVRRYGKRG
jgi:hypothetical protein